MDKRVSKPFVVERWIVVCHNKYSDNEPDYVEVYKSREAAFRASSRLRYINITVLAIEHVKWTYDET